MCWGCWALVANVAISGCVVGDHGLNAFLVQEKHQEAGAGDQRAAEYRRAWGGERGCMRVSERVSEFWK